VKRIDVLTLIPEAFGWLLAQHPVADAIESGTAAVGVHNMRDYSTLSHRQVDDTPYGGGPGMVLRVDVVAAALAGVFAVPPEEVRREREVILLSPGGEPYDDTLAASLAEDGRDLVLLCGRYEGFDARVGLLFASRELSVGPYVLAGGEVAAMAVIESVVRRLPGVLGNELSVVEESFSPELGGAVEYPQYTRPREFGGVAVPEVLVGGNHALIERWRREQAHLSLWPEWARGMAGRGSDGEERGPHQGAGET